MTNAGFCFCCCLGFEATENGMINFGVLCLQLLTLITFEA
jgi:hypothetical protein